MIKFKVKVMLAIREMTQKELAEKTGIRPPTISAICTGTIKHLPVALVGVQARGFSHAMEKRRLLTCLV